MSKEIDNYLNSVVQKGDEKLGIGGNWLVLVSQEIENQLVGLFGVHNLTYDAAKILFDQIDESNIISDDNKLIIQLLQKKGDNQFTEHDMTIIPNVFTDNL